MQINKLFGRALLASLALSLSLFITPATNAATVNSFDDIEFWTGTGSKESALVIQFNDGNSPVSLAWGYRWDDPATTVETMLTSLAGTIVGGPDPIAGSDFRLGLTLSTFGSTPGYFVVTLSYNQIGLTDMDQVVRSQSSNDVTWEYWSFYIGATGDLFPSGGTFNYSDDLGISGYTLSDKGWYGLAYPPFDPTYDFAIPEAAAVPEPSTILLLVIAGGLVALRIHRNARTKNSIFLS